MIRFIRWDKSIDADFRSSYFAITGESIQNEPRDIDTGFEIGTSRLSPEHEALLTAIEGVSIFSEPSAYKSPEQLQYEAEMIAFLQGV